MTGPDSHTSRAANIRQNITGTKTEYPACSHNLPHRKTRLRWHHLMKTISTRPATNTCRVPPPGRHARAGSTATGSSPTGAMACGSRKVSSMTSFRPRRINRSNGSTNPLLGRSNSAGSRPRRPIRRKHVLSARVVARRIRQAIDALKENLIHQRHALLERGSHAGHVIVAQQPFAQEEPLLHDADSGERRTVLGLGSDPSAHGRVQSVGQRFGKIHAPAVLAGNPEEECVGQLVENQQIVPVARFSGILAQRVWGGTAPPERRSPPVANAATATCRSRGTQPSAP